MPYVNTTFLPKTNGLVFADRLTARSDKGRVYGLGARPVILTSTAWVTTGSPAGGSTIEASTAVFGGDFTSTRWRYRTRPTASDSWTNGPWTNYNNTQQTVSFTAPATGFQVAFQTQAVNSEFGNKLSSTNVKTMS